MLEEEPDTSAVIRNVVARMEHVPWWQRYFNVGMLRFAAVGALVVLVFFVRRGVYGFAMAAAHDHYMDLVVPKPRDWAYSGAPTAAFVQTNFPETPDLVRMITPARGPLEKVRHRNLKGTHYLMTGRTSGGCRFFLAIFRWCGCRSGWPCPCCGHRGPGKQVVAGPFSAGLAQLSREPSLGSHFLW